jgi:hypothetical protein
MKRYSLFLVFIVLLVIGVCLFQTHNQKKKATPPLPLPNEIVDHTPSSREIVSVKPEDVTRIPSQMDMKELADIHKAPTSSKQDEISSKTQSGGAGIKGIVKDKDTGEIVRDLPIKISNQKGNVTRLLNTKPEWKSDGSFIFTNLDGGTYHLVSEDDLYLLIVENIRVNSGEIKDLKGIFAEKMLAKIRVFTRDDQTNIPIQNCSISLIQIRQNLWRTGKTTKTGETDENGQFEAEKGITRKPSGRLDWKTALQKNS